MSIGPPSVGRKFGRDSGALPIRATLIAYSAEKVRISDRKDSSVAILRSEALVVSERTPASFFRTEPAAGHSGA